MYRCCFSILCIFFRFGVIADTLSSQEIPPALDCFIGSFAQEGEKLGLTLVTKNIDGECLIDEVGLFFDFYGDPSFQDSQRLVVEVLSQFLEKINQEEKLRCYFSTFPLTPDELNIWIRVRRTGCFYPYLRNIVYISAIDGFINYGTLNPLNYKINLLRREPYLRALERVQSSHS